MTVKISNSNNFPLMGNINNTSNNYNAFSSQSTTVDIKKLINEKISKKAILGNKRLENYLTSNGINVKKITPNDVEFSKDIAILKIALGLIVARQHESDFEGIVEKIDNFNYNLELENTIEHIDKKRFELSEMFDPRKERIIRIFKDPVFHIYVQIFDKYTDKLLKEGGKVNIESLAILLINMRFRDTDLTKTSLAKSKIIKKNKGIKPRRILDSKLNKFLLTLDTKSLEKCILSFSENKYEYDIAKKIIDETSELITNVEKI